MSGIQHDHGPLRVASVIVRDLSPRFVDCEREDRGSALDLDLARAQHHAYVEAIRELVGEVLSLEASVEHPDCVFVEDTAVILDDGHALLTCPGAASRRGETPAVAKALWDLGFAVITMEAPAHLDGGDVLRVGGHLFVGLSGRTNELGAQQLACVAREHGLTTHVVRVRSGLHLRSSCSLADDSTLLYARSSGIDTAPFAQIGLACLPMDEPMGGNVLALGGGNVLVSDAAPATAVMLARRGLKTRMLSMSEMHKADAALTCPSIRLPARGCWCT